MAGTEKVSNRVRRDWLLREAANWSDRTMWSSRAENRSLAALGKKGWVVWESFSEKKLLAISRMVSSTRSSLLTSPNRFQ